MRLFFTLMALIVIATLIGFVVSVYPMVSLRMPLGLWIMSSAFLLLGTFFAGFLISLSVTWRE